jgi:hypothetical protein
MLQLMIGKQNNRERRSGLSFCYCNPKPGRCAASRLLPIYKLVAGGHDLRDR